MAMLMPDYAPRQQFFGRRPLVFGNAADLQELASTACQQVAKNAASGWLD
jgi:hypothetical protein